VISTAIKKSKADRRWIDAAIVSMTTLNQKAVEVIANAETTKAGVGTAASSEARQPDGQSLTPGARFLVHSMTDITGFGLIGHLREILLASNVSARISAGKVPMLDGALDCIHAGHIPGGLNNNRAFAECLVEYDDPVPQDLRTILYDPQTAGGLLISTPEGEALRQALKQAEVPAVQIGEVFPQSNPRIRVSR
jgi:selenide,water dikinase